MVRGDRLLQLIEQHDRHLAGLEDEAIGRVNSALEASYRQLEKKLINSYQQHSGNLDLLPNQRSAVILSDVANLMQLVNPKNAERVQRDYENLLRGASDQGGTFADAMHRAIANEKLATFANVPVGAVRFAAENAVKRLSKHSEAFREKASGVVAQGLIQGWGSRKTAAALRNQLGTTKAAAETIARTETLAASNEATQANFKANGIELFQFIATQDDRTCPYCAARNMRVYRLGESSPPIHPRCRCYSMPFKEEWLKLGLIDEAWATEFRDGAIAELEATGKSPNYGLSPFEKASGATQAPKPVWEPGQAPKPKPVPLPPTPGAIAQWAAEFADADLEHAAVFTLDGAELFRVTSDDSDHVYLTAEQAGTAKGNLVIHNHPRDLFTQQGLSFSADDIVAAWETQTAEEMVVSGDYIYRMRPPAGGWKTLKLNDMADVYERIEAEERDRWMAWKTQQLAAGRDLEDVMSDLNFGMWHRINERWSDEVGVTYARELRTGARSLAPDKLSARRAEILQQLLAQDNSDLLLGSRTYGQILAASGKAEADRLLAEKLGKVAQTRAAKQLEQEKLMLKADQKRLLEKRLRDYQARAIAELYPKMKIDDIDFFKLVEPEKFDSLLKDYNAKLRQIKVEQRAVATQRTQAKSAFDNAPDGMAKAINKLDAPEIIPPIASESPHQNGKKIHMDSVPNEDFASIYRHEWGHYYDYSNAAGDSYWSNTDKEAIAAFKADAKATGLNRRLLDALKDITDEFEVGRAAAIDRSIALDLAAALSRGRVGGGHSVEYWAIPGARETEAVANILSLLGSGNPRLREAAQRLAPQMVELLERKLNG